MVRPHWILTLLIALPISVCAQHKHTSRQNQQWLQYHHVQGLIGKWQLLADLGFRWQSRWQEPAQYIGRLGLGYALSSQWRVVGGLTQLGFYQDQSLEKVEWRPYEEVSFRHQLLGLSLNHRVRIEQRFISALRQTGYEFNHRFRYRFVLQIPLISWSKSTSIQTLKLMLADEVFFNAGPQITYNTFDQNRLLIGPSIPLTKQLTVSLLYNYQVGTLNLPQTYKQTHICWVVVKHQLK